MHYHRARNGGAGRALAPQRYQVAKREARHSDFRNQPQALARARQGPAGEAGPRAGPSHHGRHRYAHTTLFTGIASPDDSRKCETYERQHRTKVLLPPTSTAVKHFSAKFVTSNGIRSKDYCHESEIVAELKDHSSSLSQIFRNIYVHLFSDLTFPAYVPRMTRRETPIRLHSPAFPFRAGPGRARAGSVGHRPNVL